MPEVLEIVRFTVPPERRQTFLAGRDAAMAALRERCPGLVGGHLAELDDGTWCDVLRWRSRGEAETAAQQFPEIPEARSWVAHIGAVTEMRHAEIRHTIAA